ncbi:MAG: tyrosine-protein phosphatase [Flavobacteriales bacterium]
MLGKWWKHKRPEKKIEPVDLSVLQADMHSHLLFGIDDGAESLEDSIQLILHLQQLGYKKLITTPHIYQDMYRNTPDTIFPKLEIVREELKNRSIDVELSAAAEYFCDDHFEKLIEEQNLLTFSARYVLFEISFAAENANLGRAIFNMRLAGYNPILAHPERYDYWHRDFSRYESMLDKDVLLQINISSLTGQYGPGAQRIAERLIEKGMVSFVGTDCHHMGHVQLTNAARSSPYMKMLLESGKLLNHHL